MIFSLSLGVVYFKVKVALYFFKPFFDIQVAVAIFEPLL
jgi:hypothetical protein